MAALAFATRLALVTPIEECLMAPGFVELTRDGLVIYES